MDYDQLCAKILDVDSNVHLASVFNESNEHLAGRMRPGVDGYQSKEETEITVMEAVNSWQGRMKLVLRIGIPEWSITKYEKLFHFTMAVGPNELLLVSAESSINPLKLMDKLTDLINNYEDIIIINHSTTNKLTS